MTRQLLSATKEGLLEQSQYGSGSPRPALSPNPDSRGFWTSKQWRSTRMVSFQHHISDLFAAGSHFASVLGSFEAVASSWHSLLYQDPAKSHATLQASMSSQGKGVLHSEVQNHSCFGLQNQRIRETHRSSVFPESIRVRMRVGGDEAAISIEVTGCGSRFSLFTSATQLVTHFHFCTGDTQKSLIFHFTCNKNLQRKL